MTALYLAATATCIIAALVFIWAQIAISWRQFNMQCNQNWRLKEDQKKLFAELVEVKETMNEISQHLKGQDNEQ